MANQPASYSFPTNQDSFILSNSPINIYQQQSTPVTSFVEEQLYQNSSQTPTVVPTNSSFNTQRNTITNNVATMEPQQLPVTFISTANYNEYHLQTQDNDASPIHQNNDSLYNNTFYDLTTADNSLSYTSSQVVHTPYHGHQQFTTRSSNLSQKKRGRPKLHERIQYATKPIKSRSLIQSAKSTRLLMPEPTIMTSMDNIRINSNNCSSDCSNNRIDHTNITPAIHSSLSQQQYYPSLLIGKTSSTNILPASISSSRPSVITSTTTTIPNTVQSICLSTKYINQIQDNDEEEIEKENNRLPSDPKKWTIVQVGHFIEQITNQTIAEVFRKNEVDGTALLLLEKEDLRHDMKIILGPSVKILSKIKELRGRAQ
ncbi:unnamed protein product [Rotaria socialis]|uniref:SAM domain-containing protein n=3 Tax=Rotaria socialis TaxID=392032 RepID=A0A817ZSI1_9BILA|nr:unnamed protein product [Rotaria socialis]